MPFDNEDDLDDTSGDSRGFVVGDDNEQERGPGFGFHHIVHEEPGYRIRYREAWHRRPLVKDCVLEPDS